MLDTSKKDPFPGHYLLTTGTDDPTLIVTLKGGLKSVRSSVLVVSRWLRPGNRTFLEVASMVGVFFCTVFELTLTLPGLSAGMSGSLDSYCSLKPLCSGMGEVVPARTSPTLLPPSPRTVLTSSCFKVLQCINCRDWHFKSY